MRSSQDVTCVKVRAVCVWSIKGKQMVETTLTQRFPKPLLRNLCSDWWRRPNRRPRSSQWANVLKLCPRPPRLFHVFRHEKLLVLSEVAHSAVLLLFHVYVGVVWGFLHTFLATFDSAGEWKWTSKCTIGWKNVTLMNENECFFYIYCLNDAPEPLLCNNNCAIHFFF